MTFEVRYGRHDGIGGPTSVSFDDPDDAEHYASIVEEDDEMWVEWNPIEVFAAQVEKVTLERTSLAQREFDLAVGGGNSIPPEHRKPSCIECGHPTDVIFHRESGGLCGVCLADHALPLTFVWGQR
jgi:hypothetical protein